MRKFYLLSLLFIVALSVHGQKLPFQGKLIEDGTPVNGIRSISVSIPAVGWSETHSDVSITDGLYFIVLGSSTPIPGNIFDGTDERQMEISVDETTLSPVTLYKPLNGEMKELRIQGPGNGLLHARFGSGSEQNENLPSVAMRGSLDGNRLWLGVSPNNDGTVESGAMRMNSTNGDFSILNSTVMYLSSPSESTGAFLSNQLWLRQGERFNLQLFNQNWGNLGHSGTILLRGPNSTNFEISSRHWENPDLPRINMLGSSDNQIIELTAGKYPGIGGEKEKGVIILQDSDGNKSSITPHHFSVNGPDWKEYVVISGTNTGDNTHSGNIMLTGQDDKRLGINADGITMFDDSSQRGLSLRSSNHGSSSLQGLIELFGTNSPEPYKRTAVLGTNDWGNGDFGALSLYGSHAQTVFTDKSNTERIILGLVDTDGQTGRLLMKGLNPHLVLQDFNNQNRVFIQSKEGEGGSSGQIILNGPNSGNFYLGSASWDNSDIPFMFMSGADNKQKLHISTITDNQGERGIITLTNSDDITTTYANNGVWGTQPFGIFNDASVSGHLYVGGDFISSGSISAPIINQTSDERLKKDIQPLNSNILGRIESLGGYSYSWKQEEYPEKNFSSDQQIGLLAQELEAQFPALVKTGTDGFKSVNYNGFTAVLLQAVKELNHKVESLEKENRLLKDELVAASASQNEMNELRSQIGMLARLVQVKIDSAGDAQSAENVSTNSLK